MEHTEYIHEAHTYIHSINYIIPLTGSQQDNADILCTALPLPGQSKKHKYIDKHTFISICYWAYCHHTDEPDAVCWETLLVYWSAFMLNKNTHGREFYGASPSHQGH